MPFCPTSGRKALCSCCCPLTIFDTFLTNYSEAIRFHLERRNVIVDVDDLNELLGQNEVFGECVKAISTEWTLEQYCHNQLGMVRLVEKILRDDEGNHRATFQYIRLLDVLQKVRENMFSMFGQC